MDNGSKINLLQPNLSRGGLWSPAVNPGAGSSGNGGWRLSLANQETKPSPSASPTNHATRTWRPNGTWRRAIPKSSISQPPPPMPNQKLVSSEETRGQSGDAIVVEEKAPQELSDDFFAGDTPEELYQLQSLIENLKRDFQRSNRQNRNQRQSIQELEQENTRLKENNRALHDELNNSLRELKEAKTRVNNLERDLNREIQESGDQKQRCQQLGQEIKRLKDNKALHHELSNSLRELKEAKSLSDTRGEELMGTQVSLTKADSLSISDVIDKVGILNEEIFQTAALFAEEIRHAKRDINPETLAQSQNQVRLALGEQMKQILQDQGQLHKPNSEVNPLLGQAVISSYIVHFCSTKLNSWCPSNPAIADFLTQVYSQMRQSEEQAVFGRWRSLTHTQIRPPSDKWATELCKSLDHLFFVASWDAPYDVKKALFLKLARMFKATDDLRGALYEKFTSADLEVFCPDPFGPFQPWMEDAYGDGRKAQGNVENTEIVAGTTGIGLRKFKSRGNGDGSYIVVSPVKVVLLSTLQEALEPPAPTKARSKKRGVPPPPDNGVASVNILKEEARDGRD